MARSQFTEIEKAVLRTASEFHRLRASLPLNHVMRKRLEPLGEALKCLVKALEATK